MYGSVFNKLNMFLVRLFLLWILWKQRPFLCFIVLVCLKPVTVEESGENSKTVDADFAQINKRCVLRRKYRWGGALPNPKVENGHALESHLAHRIYIFLGPNSCVFGYFRIIPRELWKFQVPWSIEFGGNDVISIHNYIIRISCINNNLIRRNFDRRYTGRL